MKSKSSPLFSVISATFTAISVSSVACAGSLAWDGDGADGFNPAGGTGTWDANGNLNWWNEATHVKWPAAGGTDDDAVFGNTAGVVSIAAGGVTANDLTFNTTGYTIQNNTLTLNGTNPTLTTASGVSATISSAIAGSSGLIKTGAGTLTLSSTSNSFSGGVSISGGTLSIAAATNLPSGNVLTLSGGGVLAVSAAMTLANHVTVASGESGVIRATGNGHAILTGNYSNVAGMLELDLGNGGRIDINSANGPGVGSTVRVSDAAASGPNYMGMNNANAQSFFTNAKVTFNDTGAGETNVYLGNNAGNWNFNFGALDGGASTTKITSDNRNNKVTITGVADGNFAGDISNGAGSGVISLVKNGNSTQILSGNNTYTGSTLVSAGTLLVHGALGATAVTVEEGGILGGTGSIAGSVNFDIGARLYVSDFTDALSISGSVTFDGFGFDNLAGWDYANAENGIYTLLAGSNFDLTHVANVGADNALILGDGRSAYFQNGSLQVVIIPEPGTALLGGLGLLALLRRRR